MSAILLLKDRILGTLEIVLKPHTTCRSRFLELLNADMKIGLIHDILAVENESSLAPGDAYVGRFRYSRPGIILDGSSSRS